jgi:hypothetical protein
MVMSAAQVKRKGTWLPAWSGIGASVDTNANIAKAKLAQRSQCLIAVVFMLWIGCCGL